MAHAGRHAVSAVILFLAAHTFGQAPSVDTLIARITGNLDKITTFQADAWIRECS